MIDNLSDKPEHRPADEPDTPQAPPERLNDPVETADGTPSAEKPRRGWAPPRSGPGMTSLFIALIVGGVLRSEEHTSELQSLMRISYDVSCLNKKTHNKK